MMLKTYYESVIRQMSIILVLQIWPKKQLFFKQKKVIDRKKRHFKFELEYLAVTEENKSFSVPKKCFIYLKCAFAHFTQRNMSV